MNEIWRSIDGFDGFYEVSSLGNVRSLDRTVDVIYKGVPRTRKYKGRLLSPSNKRSQSGHVNVVLGGGKSGTFRASIHTLVLEAFVCPRPPGKECRHLDDNPANNIVGNLCWGTRSENLKDAHKNGKREAVIASLKDPERRARHSAFMSKRMKEVWEERKKLQQSA